MKVIEDTEFLIGLASRVNIGFLKFSFFDILDWIILHSDSCPVNYRMFCIMPGLYPLDVSGYNNQKSSGHWKILQFKLSFLLWREARLMYCSVSVKDFPLAQKLFPFSLPVGPKNFTFISQPANSEGGKQEERDCRQTEPAWWVNSALGFSLPLQPGAKIAPLGLKGVWGHLWGAEGGRLWEESTKWSLGSLIDAQRLVCSEKKSLECREMAALSLGRRCLEKRGSK
jgi:hypothetical protein